MTRILLTGATGFLGQNLIHQLSPLKYEVACLCRRYPDWAASLDNISWIFGELALTDAALAQIIDFAPDIIVHLAWQGIPDYSFEVSSQNVSLTTKFFATILDYLTIKKIIVTGSCWEAGSVSGSVPPGEWHPTNDFTWAKYAIHQYLSMRSEKANFDLIWARLFYLFGPGQKSQSLIPMVIKNLIKTGKLPELREPKNAHDFIFVHDVSLAIISLINHPKANGMFNIGGGYAYCATDVSNYLMAVYHRHINYDIMTIPEISAEGNTGIFWADTSSLTALTGWTPQFSIEKGLAKMLNYSIMKVDP